jgi:hypothetical protein
MSASALPSMMTVAEFLELPDELVEPDNGVVVDRGSGLAQRRRHPGLSGLSLLTGRLDGHPRCRVVIEPGVALVGFATIRL